MINKKVLRFHPARARDASRSARRRTVSLKSRRVRSVCETNVRRLRADIERTEGIELDGDRG